MRAAVILALTLARPVRAELAPKRFEWAITGTLHAVPVTATADVLEDGTWRMIFTSQPGGAPPVVRLELAGTWSNANAIDPACLRFKSSYADANVVICPKGGNAFFVASSNVDMQLDEIRLPEGWAAVKAEERATHPFWTRQTDPQPDLALEAATR